MMSGTIFFIFNYQSFQLHLLYQESQLVAKRIQHQKEEERVVSKSRPAVMNMSSYFIATSSSAASCPIASKSQGMPLGSGKPDSRIRRSVDVSSATQGCIPWRVDGKAAERPVAGRRRIFRRLRQSCGGNLVLQRGTCCPKQ